MSQPDMTFPVVPFQPPQQGQITFPDEVSPYSPLWWTEQVIANIPADSVGWLVAQGWQITNIDYDNTTIPPTPYYTMQRNSLQNWNVLQSLLSSWTVAYNDARFANSLRYNQVIVSWTDLLTSSQAHFQAQVQEQNTHVAVYLLNMDAYMDEVAADIAANESQLVADAAVATTALTILDNRLVDLEANVAVHTPTINGLLTDQASYLDSFLVAFVAKRTELDANYTLHLGYIESLLQDAETDLTTFAATQANLLAELSAAYTTHVVEIDALLATAAGYLAQIETDINDVLTNIVSDYVALDAEIDVLLASGAATLTTHAGDYNVVLALLEADYNTHVIVATAFLENLGVTELARIIEAYNATLSTQTQQLVDRGLYSAALATDVTARNSRDRSEEIGILNDRLMREKWENQHKLYEQQQSMRDRTLGGKDRVYGLRQDVLRYHASQITGVYGLLQDVRNRTLSGKQAIYAIKDANARLNIEVRSTLYRAGQEMRQVLIEEAARLQQLTQTITQWKAGQRDRLLEQIQQIVAQHLAGLDRQHTAQQDVSRVAMSQRDTLLGQLQDAVKGFLTGKERFAAMTMANASTLADHRHRMVVEKMNMFVVRLGGLNEKNAENMKLMAYQLDERNKLMIGLYGFVERRDDIGPSIEDLAKIVTSLGDAGGGWITP
jgi:hypothetical protein